MARGHRRRGAHDEEHENHERWLVTYADMVTLLMVLFIVMFAMSQVDQKKFNALKTGLAAGFGQSDSVLTGSESILDQPGSQAVEPVLPGNEISGQLSPQVQQAVQQETARIEKLKADRRAVAARVEADRLKAVLQKVRRALAAKGLLGDVAMTIDERGLVISLVSRHVTFQPNLASLSERGRLVVDTLAPVLKKLTEPLAVGGHTNQVKVKPKYFPTDWELSAARAVNVLRYLNEKGGIPNNRMTASAYGHTRPLVDPRKPGSQAINKRVDIVVTSTLPADIRTLMAQIARTRLKAEGGVS